MDKYEYIDTTGHLVTKLNLDAANKFKNGKALVKKGNEWFMIDRNFNMILIAAPIISLAEAKSKVGNFNKQMETLCISNSLNDQIGANMAIISDRILKAGYMPDGFEQMNGYRIYKYRMRE